MITLFRLKLQDLTEVSATLILRIRANHSATTVAPVAFVAELGSAVAVPGGNSSLGLAALQRCSP